MKSASPKSTVRIAIIAILWFLFALVTLLLFPLLPTILGDYLWLGLFALACLAAFAALIGAFLRSYVKKRRGVAYSFKRDWLFSWFLSFLVAGNLVALPLMVATTFNIVSQNHNLPKVTFSNGEKTVVFQGMVHIASPEFYKQVAYDLVQAEEHGHIIYYEGLRTSEIGEEQTEAEREEERRFDLLNGTDGLEVQYDTFAEVCGFSTQHEYLGFFNEKQRTNPTQHVNADMSVTDIMAEFYREFPNHPEWADQVPVELGGTMKADDAESDILAGELEQLADIYQMLNQDQKEAVAELCKMSLGFSARHVLTGEVDENSLTDTLLLTLRNEALADRILNEPSNNIYITYGAAHLSGVFTLLKEADPNWQVMDISWKNANEFVEGYSGKLYLDN